VLSGTMKTPLYIDADIAVPTRNGFNDSLISFFTRWK